MAKRRCDHCGAEFFPRQAEHRFCSTVCKDAYHTDERRRAIDLLRSSSYYGRELVGASENADRYAAVGAVNLEGALPAPAWSHDPVGQEPAIEGNPLEFGEALGGGAND